MSYAKQKGTAFETAIVNYFKENGFETPRRIALSGAAGDKGDVWLGSNPTVPSLVIECKNYAKELPYKMVEDFVGEAHTEYCNAKNLDTDRVNSCRALLIVKRVNLGTADSWIIWKNIHGVTIRARLGDVIDVYRKAIHKDEEDTLHDSIDEEHKINKFVSILRNNAVI